ncbi:MAG: hypothetical protein ABFQ64_03965 [Campylobacterota bacterium]
MQNNAKEQLQNELENYLQKRGDFTPYYPGMKTLSSALYREQLQEAIELVNRQDDTSLSDFEIYLDTIIINMHTKVKKYKQSSYFDDENIKDIQNQGFTIPFYIDEEMGLYILLGIIPSQAAS